jgi:hypothetical protein
MRAIRTLLVLLGTVLAPQTAYAEMWAGSLIAGYVGPSSKFPCGKYFYEVPGGKRIVMHFKNQVKQELYVSNYLVDLDKTTIQVDDRREIPFATVLNGEAMRATIVLSRKDLAQAPCLKK